MTQQERNALRECWQSPRKSVGVNDLNHCRQGGCHLVCRGSSRGRGGVRAGGLVRIWWGNMPKSGSVRSGPPLLTMTSWHHFFHHGKRAGGNLQLPTGCHALWVEKYFSIGKCLLQTIYSSDFCSNFVNLVFIMFHHVLFACLVDFLRSSTEDSTKHRSLNWMRHKNISRSLLVRARQVRTGVSVSIRRPLICRSLVCPNR